MLSISVTINLLIALLCLYSGFRMTTWISYFISRYEHYKFVRPLMPVDVDESKLCKIHEWSETKVYGQNGEFEDLTFCIDCGFIPSRNIMASQAGIESIVKNTKLIWKSEQLKKDFIAKETDEFKQLFKEEIANGMDLGKVIRVYNAGQMSRQRFIMFKETKGEYNE